MQSFCRHGSWARHHAETFRACASASIKAAELWQPINKAPSPTIATAAGMGLLRVVELAFVAIGETSLYPWLDADSQVGAPVHCAQ
jgi:hypothetical protein